MKRTWLAVTILLTAVSFSHGQVTTETPGWFEFDVPALAVPDGGVVDLSYLNKAPISGPGFAAARDGHFVDASGHRLRLFGTNIKCPGTKIGRGSLPTIGDSVRPSARPFLWT